MAKWTVVGAVHAGKFLGVVEAETKEEALKLADNLDTLHVSLCHQCSSECEDPEIVEIIVERE